METVVGVSCWTLAGIYSQNGVGSVIPERVNGSGGWVFQDLRQRTKVFVELKLDGLVALPQTPGFVFPVVGPEVGEDQAKGSKGGQPEWKQRGAALQLFLRVHHAGNPPENPGLFELMPRVGLGK